MMRIMHVVIDTLLTVIGIPGAAACIKDCYRVPLSKASGELSY